MCGLLDGPQAFVTGRAVAKRPPAGTVRTSTARSQVCLPAGSVVADQDKHSSFYRPCVVCGKLTNRVSYGHASGVIIDVCGITASGSMPGRASSPGFEQAGPSLRPRRSTRWSSRLPISYVAALNRVQPRVSLVRQAACSAARPAESPIISAPMRSLRSPLHRLRSRVDEDSGVQ